MIHISVNILEWNTRKGIGQDDHCKIEDLLGTRVYLELWVKVRKKWRTNERELQRMGYNLSQ